MHFSLGTDLLSLFADYYQQSPVEKQAIRMQVLRHLAQQGESLKSYFIGLIRQRRYAELELVMPLLIEMNELIYLSIVHEILSSDYFGCHEDFVHFVQKMKRPESVPFIEKSIQIRLSRPPYVGLSMYYNQCGYALRDIGTPEALTLIEKCTQSTDPILSAGMKSFIAANMNGPAFKHPDDLWW